MVVAAKIEMHQCLTKWMYYDYIRDKKRKVRPADAAYAVIVKDPSGANGRWERDAMHLKMLNELNIAKIIYVLNWQKKKLSVGRAPPHFKHAYSLSMFLICLLFPGRIWFIDNFAQKNRAEEVASDFVAQPKY